MLIIKKDDPLAITLSVIALVMGVVSFMFAVVPCVGVLSLFMGAAALVFSAIALYLTYKRQTNKAIAIAALILSAVATAIGGSQAIIYVTARKIMLYKEQQLPPSPPQPHPNE